MRPTWACGVSLKRAQKMQLRNVDLRSVGHSNQKLSPKIDFWDFHRVYPLENLKPISPKESLIKLKNQNYGSIINIKNKPKFFGEFPSQHYALFIIHTNIQFLLSQFQLSA